MYSELMRRPGLQRPTFGELEKQAVLRLSSVFSLCLSFHCEWWTNPPKLEKWGRIGEACGEVFRSWMPGLHALGRAIFVLMAVN